ncbi:hypothetical protein [Chamaesiphon sp. OTE_75_metabat_556]|uniref:hypothetical protein n=1 Tax=Chamaesiphon sp. OTE_75_metabat_556 TaxID=2964692 RepID=UPI00286C62E7|nr:hypothetical protein [Chamaesiphon sp. OTE_75_metabat_556]
MKLSTINWLSRAIALPLFITITQILPANAAPIDRSLISLGTAARTVRSLPSVTDLNLAVPIPAKTIVPDNLDRVGTIQPRWSNPSRHHPVLKSNSERTNKTTAIGKNITLTSNLKPLAGSTIDRQNKSKVITRRKDLVATNIEVTAPAPTLKVTRKSRPSSKNLAAVSPPPLSNNYLRLVKDPSKGTNDVGNPIYTLEAYVNGQKYRTFDAVSGTVNTQNADRHMGNNAAPLPDGMYEVSNAIVPGTMSEVGRTFIGIYPKFETGRVDLGIHLDRSFNQSNGYDGTAGCIGITTTVDRDAINEFIIKYRPQSLVVKIVSSSDR